MSTNNQHQMDDSAYERLEHTRRCVEDRTRDIVRHIEAEAAKLSEHNRGLAGIYFRIADDLKQTYDLPLDQPA